MTRALVSIKFEASSPPRSNLGPIIGIGKTVGLLTARPSDLVNSTLVTGFGAVKFTGPEQSVATK